MASARGATEPIRRRLILYVHGLDPRGPAHYHALQRADAPVEDARPDRGLSIGPRRRDGRDAAWTLHAEWEEGPVEAEFLFLRWDDIIRAWWPRSSWVLARRIPEWWRAFYKLGVLGEARRTCRTVYLTALTVPVAIGLFCLAWLLICGLAALLVAALATAVGASPWLGLAGLALILPGPLAWLAIDRRANICWLNRGLLHFLDLRDGRFPGLEARREAFGDRLIAAIDDPRWDEVVVVGHSAGSIQAALMVGQALARRSDLGADGRLTLVTLGQSLTYYSLLGPSSDDAEALDRLVRATDLPWIDVTAKTDPGSGAAWPPLKGSAHEDAPRVIRRPPKFHKALSPEGFRRLRRNPTAYHFQYLRPADHIEHYDWIRLLAGPARVAP